MLKDLGKLQLLQNKLQNIENKTVIKVMIGISILSLVTSVFAVTVAYLSYSSSANWENRQLELLNSLTTSIESQTNTLSNKFNEINDHIDEVYQNIFNSEQKNK